MNRPSRQISLLMQAGLLEMKRRNDFQILCLLMGIYLFMALGVRVVDQGNPQTDAFMLNLGLNLSSFFGLVLAALTGARQMAEDIEQRSIYPLLCRPLTRGTLLTGRFFTALLCGLLVTSLFLALTFLVCPVPANLQTGMLIQFLLFQLPAICWAAAFSLMWGLCLPQLLATLISLTLIFGGELFFRLLTNLPGLKYLLPRFGSLQLANRVTGGLQALQTTDALMLLGYAFAWILFCLCAATTLFRRRAL